MNREIPPAFQFYPSDWLSSESVASLSLEQEGAYIRLLCFCWKEGSIPSDPEKLARLVGKGANSSDMAQLSELFEKHPADPSRLIHPRLEKERQKQESYKKQRSRLGKLGAKKRWHNELDGAEPAIDEPCHDDGLAIPEPMAKNASSSSSSVQESTHITRVGFAIPANEKEAVEFAARAGVPPDFASMLYHQLEGRGWVDGTGAKIHMWSSYAKSRFLKENFKTPPPDRNAPKNEKALSVHELRAVIQAKETKAMELKRKHCSEVAMGDSWSDDAQRKEFFKLKREVKELNERISNFA